VGDLMSLTYDQRSELRYAFEEAYVEPERRRACRIRHKVLAKLAPWNGHRPRGHAIEVTIEDFSTTGVGLIHTQKLRENDHYLLEVPRADKKPIWVVLRVARCLPMDDGTFGVGLEAIELVDAGSLNCNPFVVIADLGRKAMRVTTRRTKVLFMTFGIVGTCVAAFM
jgi:hypothetical protein